jgi:hypothetical protein
VQREPFTQHQDSHRRPFPEGRPLSYAMPLGIRHSLNAAPHKEDYHNKVYDGALDPSKYPAPWSCTNPRSSIEQSCL